MKHVISLLCLGLLLATLTSCYPYGVPPGHAKRYGYWPGWNAPGHYHSGWNNPGWYAPANTRGIKPKYKSPHYASHHHHWAVD